MTEELASKVFKLSGERSSRLIKFRNDLGINDFDFYPVSAAKCEDGRILVTDKSGKEVYFKFVSMIRATEVNGKEFITGRTIEVRGDTDLGLKWVLERIREIERITKEIEEI